MTSSPETVGTPVASLEQILARILRHEVGDLLQTIYAATAILQERLPPEGSERQVVSDLKTRAETCRLEIDAIVDLICPFQVTLVPLDLAALTASLLDPLRTRFARRVIHFKAQPAMIRGDGQKLAQVLPLLLRAACSLANSQVHVRVERTEENVEWNVWRDGHPAGEESLAWLEQPFSGTRHALVGLSLALARRILELHGGRVQGENPPEGGFRVRLLLPLYQEREMPIGENGENDQLVNRHGSERL